MKQFNNVLQAIAELQQGRMVLLYDSDSREQEGDLVIAAEKVTPEAINFMGRYARSFLCLTLEQSIVERLRIPMMPDYAKHENQAAFTVSIEARTGVTTGASAADRAHTIRVAVDPRSSFQDISMPGHVFPLKAVAGGVLQRAGHTEGSVDLARLAGLQPAAVIGEVMREDGSMARLPDLEEFARQHAIKLVTVNDIIAYRMAHENFMEEKASATLPLQGGAHFTVKVFRHRYTGSEHVALVSAKFKPEIPCLVRIHSECLTGDVFGSMRCDCGEQLEHALQCIAQEAGVLLYMRQEGRGIGLSDKIKAYALQSQGLDTVEANHQLGFNADQRDYGLSAQMLKALGVQQVRLLTNNPHKIEQLAAYNVEVKERVPLEMKPNPYNIDYLTTKRDKLGHLLTLLNHVKE